MKNRKTIILLLIGVILITIIGVFAFLFINQSNKEKNFKKDVIGFDFISSVEYSTDGYHGDRIKEKDNTNLTLYINGNDYIEVYDGEDLIIKLKVRLTKYKLFGDPFYTFYTEPHSTGTVDFYKEGNKYYLLLFYQTQERKEFQFVKKQEPK